MVIGMQIKNYKLKIVKTLLMFIGILYLIFLYMDIFNIQIFIPTDIIKFISIILTFIISLLLEEYAINTKGIFLLQLGLFLTIFADLFLLVLNRKYILGIALFCIIQILYSIRYDSHRTKVTIINFIIIFSILIIIYITMEVDFIFVISIYYIICLLTSTIRGIRVCTDKLYPSPNRQMIALGMIFFLFCDINVGFFNIIGYMEPAGKYINLLHNISSISIWLFYLPSQVLLCISEHRFK